MSRKFVLALGLLFVLFGVLVLTINVERVEAGGTIYIRANGLVEGTDKIHRNGDIYTFTDNINDSIVVERSNIIIDGGGFTLQGVGDGYGFNLTSISNVTIKNCQIMAFIFGVYLCDSSNSNISANNITDNFSGLIVYESMNTSIYGNTIGNNIEGGVYLRYSSNSTLRDNYISDNQFNLWVDGNEFLHFVNRIDSSNTANGKPVYYWVNHQNETVPADAGYLALINSTNIVVQNLDLRNNGQGILLAFTNSSLIAKNTIKDNIMYEGIWVFNSSFNVFSENNVTAGKYCVSLLTSHNNTFSRNYIANSFGDAIWLDGSSNNDISGNYISAAHPWGAAVIYLKNSSNNKIYHNNFVANHTQVYSVSSVSVWDCGYTSGGNYWSDYNGTDSDYDCIGNTPYFIDANNQDNYPLMGMFSSFNTSYGYAVDFISNSSISNISFNLSPIEVYPPEAILAFNVSGKIDTDGFLRVCIPKILINGSYVIMFDDQIITNTTYPQVRELPCLDETYTCFYINYTHCEHAIEISGITAIPEFPSFLILPIFMLATLLIVIVYKRKRST